MVRSLMALDVLEWGVIAVMGIAIFIYGPEKVPQIAKTLGNARRDLDVYTKQFQGITKELTSSVGSGNIDSIMGTLTGLAGSVTGPAAAEAPAGATAEDASGDKLLVDMAKKLQIPTHGKTREQIQSEIIAKASQGPATPVEATQVPSEQAGTASPEAPESPPQQAADAPAPPVPPAQESPPSPAAS